MLNGKDGSGGPFIPYHTAKEQLGISVQTLRKWADEGLIPSIRTPGGQRLYGVQQYLGTTKEGKNTETKQKFCYCRVSSQGQKDDLQRQIEYMSDKFPNHKIISDIGSGINFRRKGLRSIIQMASQGMVEQVVVAYRDRLCRFAFELIEWIFQIHGVELLVLNQEVDSSGNTELAEDLLAIVNVFNCRVNGKRKYKKHQGSKTEECKDPEANCQQVQTL